MAIPDNSEYHAKQLCSMCLEARGRTEDLRTILTYLYVTHVTAKFKKIATVGSISFDPL